MGKDIKEQSTEELKRKLKTGKVILIVCWSAVIISIVITLFYGKSPSISACSAAVTLSKTPTESPFLVLPVIFAAPRMLVNSGTCA